MNGESQSLPYSTARKLDQTCDDFEAAFNQGRRPAIEEYLKGVTGPERDALLRSLLAVEIELLASRGPIPKLEQYQQRFPDSGEIVSEAYREGLERSGASQVKRPAVTGEDAPRHDFPETVSMLESGGNTSHSSPREADDAEPVLGPEFGRFCNLTLLGQGGFGFVYRAYDPDLDREVALKVPRFETSQSGEHVERFLREARSAAILRHPNICPVHEIGEQEGRPYIVMGFIEGKPLSAYVKPDKPLTQRQAALVVRKVALALAAAHQKGIIHRDLKPHNIMIDRESREPVVMDFGLARRDASPDSHLTQSGVVMGTPRYMPPEQARGDLEAIGPASDIYSLGVTLYELLCGRGPFTGSMGEILGAILHTTPEPPSSHRPGLDPRLETICLKMMEKRPEDRYGSMAEVVAALQSWLKGEPQAPPPAEVPTIIVTDPPSRVQRRRPRRHPVSPAVLWGSLGGIVALLLGIVIIVRSPDGRETRVETDSDRATVTVDGSRIDVRTPREEPTGVQEAGAAAGPGVYALEFDADESRVEFPLTYDGSFPITVEVSVKLDRRDEPRGPALAIVGFTGPKGHRMGLGQFPPDGRLGVSFGREQGFMVQPSREVAPAEAFIHLAGVYDGERITLFQNGLHLASAAVDGPQSRAVREGSVPLTIGSTSSSFFRGRSFRGQIRMVRISKGVRYTGNFIPPDDCEPNEDTLALYLFREGEGLGLRDASGNGHHGRIIGARWVELGEDGSPDVSVATPTVTQRTVSDAVAESSETYALQFGSNDSRVDLPVTYDGSHPITLEAIVQIADQGELRPGPPRTILGTQGAYDFRQRSPIGLSLFSGRFLHVSFAHERREGRGATGAGCRSREPAPHDRFVHIAGVFDGGHVSLFVDGALGSNPMLVSPHESTEPVPVSIGGSGAMGSSFFGAMRMVRISRIARYDRNFIPPDRFESDEETLALYLFEEGEGIALRDSSGNGHHGRILGPRWVRIAEDGSFQDTSGSPRFTPRERDAFEWIFANDGHFEVTPDGEVRPTEVHSLEALDALGNRTWREWRVIYAPQDFTVEHIRRLRDLPELTYLDLCWGQTIYYMPSRNEPVAVGDAVLAELGDLRSLKTLRLNILDQELTPLARLPNLSSLHLNRVSDATVTSLADWKLKQIGTFFAARTDLTDAGVADLTRLFQASSLYLHEATNLTDGAVEHLAKMTNLRILHISNSQIGDGGAEGISTLPQLSTLNLSGSSLTDAGLRHLQGATKLRTLNVSNTQVTAAGVAAFRAANPACKVDWDEDGGSTNRDEGTD